MDVAFQLSIFRLYPGSNVRLNTIVFAKTFFSVHVSVGILDFPYMRWTKILNLVEPLDMGTHTWSFISSFQTI